MPPRALLRLARILAANVFWIAVWGLGALLTSCAPAARRRWRGVTFGRWGRSVTRALGLELEVRGPVPSAPCLLVTNHASYADIPVLAALVNGWFVAKAEIRRWPMGGLLARGVGTIFVERGARRDLVESSRAIEGRLARGYSVFLFPEGGIPPGPGVGAFHGSLLEPAVRHGLGVRWAAIRYATGPGEPPAEQAIEWRTGEPIYAHLARLLSLRGARAVVHFGEGELAGSDRKALAQELRARVAGLYEQAAG